MRRRATRERTGWVRKLVKSSVEKIWRRKRKRGRRLHRHPHPTPIPPPSPTRSRKPPSSSILTPARARAQESQASLPFSPLGIPSLLDHQDQLQEPQPQEHPDPNQQLLGYPLDIPQTSPSHPSLRPYYHQRTSQPPATSFLTYAHEHPDGPMLTEGAFTHDHSSLGMSSFDVGGIDRYGEGEEFGEEPPWGNNGTINPLMLFGSSSGSALVGDLDADEDGWNATHASLSPPPPPSVPLPRRLVDDYASSSPASTPSRSVSPALPPISMPVPDDWKDKEEGPSRARNHKARVRPEAADEGDLDEDVLGPLDVVLDDSDDDDYVPAKAKSGSPGKDKGKAKMTSGAKDGPTKLQAQAGESTEATSARDKTPPIGTFCHQCRTRSLRPKVKCTNLKKDGIQCTMFYCLGCMGKRYPEVDIDSASQSFSCPRCEDTCNCTQCAAKRGEVYVSERNGGWRRWGPSSVQPKQAVKQLDSEKVVQRRAKQQHKALGQHEAATQNLTATTTERRARTSLTSRRALRSITPPSPTRSVRSPVAKHTDKDKPALFDAGTTFSRIYGGNGEVVGSLTMVGENRGQLLLSRPEQWSPEPELELDSLAGPEPEPMSGHAAIPMVEPVPQPTPEQVPVPVPVPKPPLPAPVPVPDPDIEEESEYEFHPVRWDTVSGSDSEFDVDNNDAKRSKGKPSGPPKTSARHVFVGMKRRSWRKPKPVGPKSVSTQDIMKMPPSIARQFYVGALPRVRVPPSTDDQPGLGDYADPSSPTSSDLTDLSTLGEEDEDGSGDIAPSWPGQVDDPPPTTPEHDQFTPPTAIDSEFTKEGVSEILNNLTPTHFEGILSSSLRAASSGTESAGPT
ncbi:hypothetical protein OF83DRAFT_439215 [Amylostereum chailletii]|nr:hypothetical protein OF83DRAFT_439215 [Amylostereum chailletii]